MGWLPSCTEIMISLEGGGVRLRKQRRMGMYSLCLPHTLFVPRTAPQLPALKDVTRGCLAGLVCVCISHEILRGLSLLFLSIS